jgi:predicted permease
VAGTAAGIGTLVVLRSGFAAAGDPDFARACLMESMMPSAVFSAVLPARYGAGRTLPATIVLLSTIFFPFWVLAVLRYVHH